MLFCYLVMSPRLLAQAVIVSDNSPIDTGRYCSTFDGVYVETDKDIRDCYLAQAFTLTSPAFVNQLTLTLIGNAKGASTASTYPFLS
jgi:hypothetical protein